MKADLWLRGEAWSGVVQYNNFKNHQIALQNYDYYH
jgi:hypothetical protein